MIHLMLNDLRHPAAVFPVLLLEILILIVDFDLLIPGAGPHTFQRKTAFLGLVGSPLFRDHRIDHDHIDPDAGF